jgi:UDP-N-acetylmuramyl pentapeptide phosphotransferase/UDP-N-acetylglucosamine-1-phosphate transferase
MVEFRIYLIISILLCVVALSYLGVARIRIWARRINLIDIPNERSSHATPMPRGGGIAIVFSLLFGYSVYWFCFGMESGQKFLIYTIGTSIIAAVSWLDDLRSLSAPIRLAVHVLCALLAVFGAGYGSCLSIMSGSICLPDWIAATIAVVWIVGLTNAFNFMDGIDGISAGQAVIAGCGWALLGWLRGMPDVAMLGMITAAASLGFLRHNWPPARIFMGDVGSASLGYSCAVLTLMAAQGSPRYGFAGVLFLWPFIFDTSYTFLKRLWKGENVLAPHRSHLYQRLVVSGLSHRTVTCIYLVLSMFGVLLGLGLASDVRGMGLAVPLIILSLCVTLALSSSLLEKWIQTKST